MTNGKVKKKVNGVLSVLKLDYGKHFNCQEFRTLYILEFRTLFIHPLPGHPVAAEIPHSIR